MAGATRSSKELFQKDKKLEEPVGEMAERTQKNDLNLVRQPLLSSHTDTLSSGGDIEPIRKYKCEQ